MGLITPYFMYMGVPRVPFVSQFDGPNINFNWPIDFD